MKTLEDMIPAARAIPADRAAQLRHEIVAWADTVPTDRPARASRTAFTSRTLLSGAAAVTGVALALLAIDGLTSPDRAVADWTATPSAMPATQLLELGAVCEGRVDDAFAAAPDGMTPVLGESRGSSSLALIASGSTVALCADWLGGQSGSVQEGNALAGITFDVRLAPGEDIDLIGLPGSTGNSDDGGLRIAYGLVGDNVASVRIVTVDGTELEASVGDGYFLGWWPSGADIDSLTALSDSGQVVQKLEPKT